LPLHVSFTFLRPSSEGSWTVLCTVHEPPEDGLKNGTETCRGKFLSVLMWILVLFIVYIVCVHELEYCRSQLQRGLRRRSAAAHLLRSWVRIPPRAWMFVCCECCVLSGRGLCDELITRPEESYRLWCVVVCDPETSRMWKPWPALGRSATEKKSWNINP